MQLGNLYMGYSYWILLYRVIDGENITMSDEHMWLIPFTDGGEHTLTINLTTPEEIVGLRFWNYNKSAEDTYRGVSISS